MTIRILIADDHKIVCDGLKALLTVQPEMEVVAQASNGREAVKLAIKLRPDIIIMDVAMPDLNGLKLCARSSRISLKSRSLRFRCIPTGVM